MTKFENSLVYTGKVVTEPVEKAFAFNTKTTFALRVLTSTKDAEGNNAYKSSLLNCTFWRKNGTPASDLLKKDATLTFKGQLDAEQWQTPEGQRRDRLDFIVRSFSLPEEKEA